MEAKFGQTKQGSNIFCLLFVLVLLGGSFTAAFTEMIWKFTAATIWIIIAMAIIFINYSGKIIANENGVTIVKTFFGKKVEEKFIEYGSISGTECGINANRTRIGTRYTMEFTLKMRDGSKIAVFGTMNIGSRFPAEQPDKYKQYLHDQPLMQISHYIDGKLHLNVSA